MKLETLLDMVQSSSGQIKDFKWRVHYILSEEASIGRDMFYDPDSTFGREFQSIVCLDDIYERDMFEILDYTYPYAKQEDGTWLMTGRVIKDWSKVVPISIELLNEK